MYDVLQNKIGPSLTRHWYFSIISLDSTIRLFTFPAAFGCATILIFLAYWVAVQFGVALSENFIKIPNKAHPRCTLAANCKLPHINLLIILNLKSLDFNYFYDKISI